MHVLWTNPVPIRLGFAQPQPDASTLPPATLEAPLFQPRDWAAAFTSQTGEFEYWVDEVEGQVPEHLRGTLFRNGPGMFGAQPAGRPKASVRSQSSSVSAAVLTQSLHAIAPAVGADTRVLGSGGGGGSVQRTPFCAQGHARPIFCTRQGQPLVHSACKRLYQGAGGPPTQECL